MVASRPRASTASRVTRSRFLQLVQPVPSTLMIMIVPFSSRLGSGEDEVEQVADGDDAGSDDADERGEKPVSYTHLRAHETPEQLVCRLLLEKKKHNNTIKDKQSIEFRHNNNKTNNLMTK